MSKTTKEKADRRWLLERRVSVRVNRYGKVTWARFASTRRTHRWVRVGQAPPQTIEWCVEKYQKFIMELQIKTGFNTRPNVLNSVYLRIRNVDTDEVIPVEALGA